MANRRSRSPTPIVEPSSPQPKATTPVEPAKVAGLQNSKKPKKAASAWTPSSLVAAATAAAASMMPQAQHQNKSATPEKQKTTGTASSTISPPFMTPPKPQARASSSQNSGPTTRNKARAGLKGLTTKDSSGKDAFTEENESIRRLSSPIVKQQVQADQLRNAMNKRGLAAQTAKRLQKLDKHRGSNFAHTPPSCNNSATNSVTEEDDISAVGSECSMNSTLSYFEEHLDDLEAELREDAKFNPSNEEMDL